MTDEKPIVDNAAILDTLLARWRFPCLSAALEVGVFDALHKAPADAATLAERLGLNGRAMRAVLPVVAASGLLSSHDGVYSLTDEARTYLLPESPFFFGPKLSPQARTSGEHDRLVKALTQPDYTTDASTLDRAVEEWESGQMPAEKAKRIAVYMHSETVAQSVGAAESGLFKGIKRLLDVGGGSGCFSIAVANAQPETHCTVLELPAMCEEAKTYIADAGRQNRVSVAPVDMFREPWPGGHDGVIFSNIYHDWPFETCHRLTALTFDALPAGGRIFLHEMLYDDGHTGPLVAAGFSAQMLLDTQGQQFTFRELKDMLEAAGFTNVTATQTFSYYSVVTGVKP